MVRRRWRAELRPFAPDDLADIHANEAALAEVSCQGCGTRFTVALTNAFADEDLSLGDVIRLRLARGQPLTVLQSRLERRRSSQGYQGLKNTLDPLDAKIGSRIRFRREQLGLTQSQLGEQLGVTFQQIQKYERGTNRVAASRIAALSSIFKVPSTFFFSGSMDDEDCGRVAVDDRFLELVDEQDRDARRLLRAFSLIGNAEDRKKVVVIVEAMAEALAGAQGERAEVPSGA